MEQAGKLAESIEEELLALATERRKRAAQEARRWATAASKGTGHQATKAATPVLVASASGAKNNLGETTSQSAADSGIVEWGKCWKAEDDDWGSEILAAIEAVECTTQREPDIVLPRIDGQQVQATGKRFRGSTGVGRDWMRPKACNHAV
jgi:hypothetical protein